MRQVIKMLKEKREELKKELDFDEEMLEQNCGSPYVQGLRRKCVNENTKVIGQINRTLALIIKHT